MYDLVIIHSQDTTAWTNYILGYLNRGSFNKKTHILRDADLVSRLDDEETRSAISTAKAVIVIASPVHIHFLIECPTFSYYGLVPDIRRAQIFLCGSEMVDFDGRDLEGYPIFHRFPDFFSWKTLTHDKHAELLTNAMILMEAEETPVSPVTHRFKGNGSNGGKRRRKREFEITPTRVKCEEPTTITLLFAESIADSADLLTMEIVFRDKNSVDVCVEVKWRNPYNCQFLAPDLPAGVTKFTVTLNGTEIGTKTLTYYSGEECLTQIYIHQMGRLCRYIRGFGLLTSDVDSLLSEILDENQSLPIPPQAFENIFGSLCFKTEGQSQYEFPTLLHLAANFGFQEFATKLIDLPESRQAYHIRNLNGLLPEVIARNSGHLELARLFQDFHIVNETISSVYEIYLPDQRQSNRLSDASEYSVTPTAVLSSSGSEDTYMDMRGKSPRRNENSEESDNEEGGYVDMDEEELSETIQKRAEELKRHAKPENREQDKEQDSEEQLDFQPQTVAEQTNAGDDIRLESLTLEDVPNIADVPESQRELIGILTMVIQGKISVAEGEYLIKGWNFHHNHGRSRSFKEKQVQLSKMRDQVTKVKDKIKEPSWWNAIKLVLKKHPSSTSSAQPALASCAESLSLPGQSVSKSFRPPASQENLVIGAKTRKFYKFQTTPDPRPSENVSTLLEPISENPQRNSNASASSRESLGSVTSRTSTSSGVDIDTVDEEHITELELRVRNPQQGNFDHGVKYTSVCKRKSRNLEILEEELTCSDAPIPPPLPPRTGPRAESFRCQVGKQCPTSRRPGEPIKHAIKSIPLPPMPHQSRNRSSSEPCIAPLQPTSLPFSSGRPPWKSVDQPPPVSPRFLKKDTLRSTQRRPAPSVPAENWSDTAQDAVGNPQNETIVKSSSDSTMNRSYVQCPVPSSGRAAVIRSRSRDNKAKSTSKKGKLSKQAVVTDPDIETLETTDSLDESSLSESCEILSSSEFKAASSGEDLPAYRVLRAHQSPESTSLDRHGEKWYPHFEAESTQTIEEEGCEKLRPLEIKVSGNREDLPIYRVLRAHTSPELTSMGLDRHDVKLRPHFQTESTQSIGTFEKQQEDKQQELQQEEQSHFYQLQDHQSKIMCQQARANYVDVKTPAIYITTLTGEQKMEEVSEITYLPIEKPRVQAALTESIVISGKQATEEDQQPQQHEQETNYADVAIASVDITGHRAEIEEALGKKDDNVERLLGPDKPSRDSSPSADDVLFSSVDDETPTSTPTGCLRKARRSPTNKRPPPVFQIQELVHQTSQEHPMPTKTDMSTAHEVECLPYIKPGICLNLLQAPGRTESSHIETVDPINSGIPINRDATAMATTGVDDVTCAPAVIRNSSFDSRCKSTEAVTSFDELKSFLSGLDAPSESHTESMNPPSMHLEEVEPSGVEKHIISTREKTIEVQVHISKVPSQPEFELTQDECSKQIVSLSKTLSESFLASEAVISLPSVDAIQVSSSISPTLITAEPHKPGQMNVLNPGEAEISKSTEAVDSKQEPNTDRDDMTRTKKGLSASLKKPEKPKTGLERIQLQSDRRSAASAVQQLLSIERSNPRKSTNRRQENESEPEPRGVSSQISDTPIVKSMTERGTIIGEPSAKKQWPTGGTPELSAAQPKKRPPAKPPAKQPDSSSTVPALEEQLQKLKPGSDKMPDEAKSDVISSSAQLQRSSSIVIGRQEQDAVISADHESSVKVTATPPRVPSKPNKGARK